MTVAPKRFRHTAAIALAVVAITQPLSATAASIPAGNESKVTVTTSVISGSAGRSEAGSNFRVRARVPVACWVRPEAMMVAGNGVAGGVYEACNNPGGYIVTANYRPLSGSEKAKLYYDERAFDLGHAGSQVLRESSIATIKRVNYRFSEVELDSPLTLSLTIQPI